MVTPLQNCYVFADQPGLTSPRVMVKGSKNALVTITNETNTRFVIGKGLPLATMQIINKEDIKSSVEVLNTDTSKSSAHLSDAKIKVLRQMWSMTMMFNLTNCKKAIFTFVATKSKPLDLPP